MKYPIPDAALSQHIAVLGKTGAGKTITAKGIVEHVVKEDAGARVCVLDTIKSDWWGLTSSADGKRAGLPFHILGGPRGHVPLHESAGKAIGELVATGQLPLSVIDMADFKPGGQMQFFAEFAPQLFKRMRGVVYLVLEEAHILAPKERAGFGHENLSIHWAKTLATAARSRGIRLIVATQRTQALHNAVLGSCDTMIAHRLTAPADKEPVVKWLKDNVDKEFLTEIAGTLSSLPTGTAWVCSGEAKFFERVKFPMITTFDNSATPEANSGEIHVQTAPVDRERLRAIIGTAVQEAEENDPKRLKAEIAQLKGEIARGAATSNVAEKINTADMEAAAEARGFERGRENGWQRGFAAGQKDGADRAKNMLLSVIESYEFVAAKVPDDPQAGSPPPQVVSFSAPVAQRSEHRASTARTTGSTPAGRSNGDATLDGPLQRIVDSIRWWNVFGIAEPTHQQVAFIANYVAGSGTWSRYLSSLRSQGLLEPKGSLVLTAAGRATARDPVEPPNAHSLRGSVMQKIDGPLQRILEPLLHAYPKSLSHEEAAAKANYEPGSGTWSRYLSSLRSLDLIEKRGPLKAQDWLFP